MTQTIPTTNRIESLDALRGVAAVSVLLFHYTVIVNRFVPNFESSVQMKYGYYGVHLFFIVSGFVILMTITRCKRGSDFIFSRFSRLYPAFWACVTLTYAIGIMFPLPNQDYSFVQYLINMSMLHQYLKVLSIDGVYWSLTYELGFYFLMYVLFKLNLIKHIDFICIIWISGALLFHYYEKLVPHPIHFMFLINSYAHLFAAGVCFYQIQKFGITTLRVVTLALIPLVQIVVDGWLGGIIVSCFLPIFYLSISNKLPIMHSRLLIFLGSISYPLYLIHQMIGFKLIEILTSQFGLSQVSVLTITSIVVILLASFITYFLDKPATRILREIRAKKRSNLFKHS